MTLLERFESKYEPEPNSGCWLCDTRTAANAKKIACHLGHVYAEVGIYVTPLGKRNCMECRRMADRRRYARQA